MTVRQTFSRIITARAQRNPHEVVVRSDHEGVDVTAAELDAHSNRLAREYLARGVGRDDLVAVGLPTGAEFVAACVAIWKLGATPHPLSPALSRTDRAALEESGRPALALGARPVEPSIPWLPSGFVPTAAGTILPDAWTHSWKAPTSSGSTGRPKIVTSTAPALLDPDRPVAPFLPRRAVQLVTAPLWHSAAFTYAFRGLLTGHRLVLTGGFDEHRFAELVSRHRITWTLLSPSMIRRLVRLTGRPSLDSLESVLHMGAPCAPADKRALIDLLGPSRVVEVYAGSESNGLTMITGTEWLAKPGSVGKPIGGTQIAIRRADGSAAAPHEVGQVWMHRGNLPAYRYLGAATRRTGDGWDTLGDLGMLDEDGYLTIVERADDVIVSDGVTVYPSRVEHALAAHPAVRDAVVYPARTGPGRTRVAAVVEVADDGVDAAAVLAYAGRRLTPAELPSLIDITRHPLRNEAGKVRRSTFRPAAYTARVPESA